MTLSQQSYAIPLALVGVLLAATMVTTLTYHGYTAEPARPSADPAESEGMALEQTRVALNELVTSAASTSPPVRLPVPTAPVPLPATLSKAVTDTEQYVLTTIVQSERQRSAIIDGHLIHVGDRLNGGAVVTAIYLDKVKIDHQGRAAVITMRAASDVKETREGDGK
ncbi:hypothetical protein H0X90_31090 [Burkholderia sp. 9775_39]|uniref:hypothetical protein n=1 Tax=unclassified Burkholderia TaxID=2613784 RepID=UPI0018C3B9FF|nr:MULTISPECIES: hypothetical protein [unclassified Burkholderia]MBG0881254.1 hypothetical protein [Burkholderia sp. 9775_39]MBG0887669.1 hypothetical protein [Burkholderia sp. 9773_38]